MNKATVPKAQEMRMLKTIKSMLVDESGVTMIEYGLLAALIAVALITVITALEGDLSALFTTIGSSL